MVSNWVRQMGHRTKGTGALQMTIKTMNNSYMMHDLGLAKSHPSVLWEDRILICVRSSRVISKFEGVVYCACQEYMIMILPKLFDCTHDDSLLVDVRFNFSQTTMRTSPPALVNNWVRQLGHRIESDGAIQPTMNTTKNNGQHDLMTGLSRRNFFHVVWDHPVVCASLYHHLLNQHEGTTNDSRLCAIFTQDWMDWLHHLFVYVKGCVGNLNVTEEAAPLQKY
jgi:hypothetical protein